MNDFTPIPDWKSLSTEERRAIFEPAWNGGATAQEISFLFTNVTRCAVIGAVHRAKLPKRPPNNGNPSRVKIHKPRPATKTVAHSAFITDPDAPPPSASVMHMIDNNRAPLAGVVPISLLDLPNREGVRCRFPVDGGYCGAQSGDRMYCESHERIVYKVTDKIRMPREARR